MTTPTTWSTLSVAALSCLLLAACGSYVDSAALEKNIATLIDKDMVGDVRVESTQCPKDPSADEDTTFTCDFTMDDGSTGEVSVTVQGGKEDFGYQVTRPASGQVEDDIVATYEKENPDAAIKTVDCEDPATGAKSSCDVEFGDGEVLKATVTTAKADSNDAFTWEVK